MKNSDSEIIFQLKGILILIIIGKSINGNMKTTVKLESKKPFVVISLEDYEGLIETLDILSSSPNIVKELAEAEEDIRKGNIVSYDDVLKKLKKRKP
jgi:PHD/YefM family antitoxin component YafN of YafNO toxin-antitoxin module